MNNEPALMDLRVFSIAARLGSFAAAAKDIGKSPAYVSKRIAILEQQLGIRLFHRTTRRIHITEEGEMVYDYARRIIENMTSMTELVTSSKLEPSGLLRIATSMRLGRHHVAHILAMLEERYPKLEIWLELLDRHVDILEEGYDIDIRVGDPKQPHLIAHRITPSRRILCAAPSYIAKRGMPQSLADLAQHECLVFRDREQAFGVWRLHGPKGLETVKVNGRYGSNHSDVVRTWGIRGLGIFMLSVWDIARYIEDGSVIQILPAYQEFADVWATTSNRSANSAKVKVAIEFLKEQLCDGPYALNTRVVP